MPVAHLTPSTPTSRSGGSWRSFRRNRTCSNAPVGRPRARCRSPRGRDAAIDPITHGEGAISELKRHGAGRARCRGTAKLQIQLLLAATAINLKRLTTRLPAVENGCADDNTAARAHLAILNACLRALAADAATTSTTGS